jgi:hypothetical protein
MQINRNAFSAAMAIAFLVIGASNALAVTMKAVLSGKFDDRFITYDYGVFGNGSEGSLSGLPFRITFLYDLDGLDVTVGGVFYGTSDPFKRAALQVGDFSDPTKSYEFDADQFGDLRINDIDISNGLLFNVYKKLSHPTTYIQALINPTFVDKNGNTYRIPKTLAEPIFLIGDNGFPIGGVGFVIYDKSQGGYVSYGTSYIDRLDITNADDMPPSVVPAPHALPLLASALIAFGALAFSRRSSRQGNLGPLYRNANALPCCWNSARIPEFSGFPSEGPQTEGYDVKLASVL